MKYLIREDVGLYPWVDSVPVLVAWAPPEPPLSELVTVGEVAFVGEETEFRRPGEA